jgi:microcompartment protein CcmK/EutM
MKRGVLCGEVWATRKASGLAGRSLKLVVELPNATRESGISSDGFDDSALLFAPLTVAIDTLDGKLGQPVLVAYGSGARNVIEPGSKNRAVLADAAVAVLLEDASEP